jgi:hypothetical protein
MDIYQKYFSSEGNVIIKPSINALSVMFCLCSFFSFPAYDLPALALEASPGLAQPISAVDIPVAEFNGRLFKRDYSVHPILGSRAGATLAKPPSIDDCRGLADIASDPNYFEHFKAEASAAQTFCHLVLNGSLSEYRSSGDSDNSERRRDVLFGYNQIPVRISYLNGRITKAEIRWRMFGPGKFKPADQNSVEQVLRDRAKKSVSLRDSLIGKSKDEIIGLCGEPPLQLGFNDIWDCRRDITANWFYWAGPLYPMRLAYKGDICFDAGIITYAQILELMGWRICQFHGSKNSNVPANLAHCALPAAGPQGKTITEIVELYGKPQRIEASGEQQKMIYPMAPNAYCELTITNGKCEEHVGMMAQVGGVPYSEMDD